MKPRKKTRKPLKVRFRDGWIDLPLCTGDDLNGRHGSTNFDATISTSTFPETGQYWDVSFEAMELFEEYLYHKAKRDKARKVKRGKV